ncbi:MAG: hypothetical protein NVSMB51_07980 [Solirubrobacteraceae bacterium]
MRPVLWRRGRLALHSYPAMLYLGLLAGTYAGSLAAADERLDPDRFTAAVLLLLVPALVGARGWFVLEHRSLYRAAPSRILRRSEGGAGMFGGLLAALVCSPVTLWLLGLPLARFWDAAAFTLLVGAMFARVGCLLTGCCAGRLSEGWLGWRLPDRTGVWRRRYPTALLEIALCAVLLGGVWKLHASHPRAGALILFVLGCYGAGRFLLDFTRATHAGRGELLPAQRVSLGIAAAAAGLTLVLALVT